MMINILQRFKSIYTQIEMFVNFFLKEWNSSIQSKQVFKTKVNIEMDLQAINNFWLV